MKSYLVEIKDYNNDVSRYIDVIADSKSSARRFAEKATKVRHNLGETVGKALEKYVDVTFDFDDDYNVVNVVRLQGGKQYEI